MSKADEVRAKVARLNQAQRHSQDQADERPAARRSQQVRASKVRRTVDLSPAHHDALNTWCNETARELGRARVTGQDVLRMLVARLLTDETLARKIRRDMAEDQ